ncbi:MAG: outer membrane lipoprotein-sorting protein [Verrucomicrobiota bacterium]|nr:outer membrane lipoprotein-sorting protein [Verrucomicrobiota bacterium]
MKNSLVHPLPQGGHDTEALPAKQSIIRPLRSAFFAFLFLCSIAHAAPPAQQILASARLRVSQQEINVQGQLRENGRIVPFRFTQTGPVIRYSFTDPDEALQLRLGESESRLEEINRSGVDKISGPEFEQKVRGTAISYEDLALKFIYWPNATVVGEDYVNTRRVWKLELLPPGRQSQYSKVFVWCEQQSGALLKMEGFDLNGQLVRRFQVVSAQQIEGRWFLKQMRIEQLDPQSGKPVATTYLEIKK